MRLAALVTTSRTATIATILTLTCSTASAQTKPDFSGTWKLDPARSQSAVQNEPITTMTEVIAQTPTTITVDITRPDGHVVHTYTLDASDGASTPGVGKAHWDGATLVTEAVGDVNGQTVTTKVVRQLNDVGEMIVETTLVVQHGYSLRGTPNYASGKDVFLRVK
jgi:hypothetical protein